MESVIFVGSHQYSFPLGQKQQSKWLGFSEFLKGYMVSYGQGFSVKKLGNIEFHLFPKLPLIGFIFYPIFSFIEIWKIVSKSNVDLIVAQDPVFSGFVCALAKILFKKRFIVQVHGDWINAPLLYKKRIFPRIVKLFLEKISYFSLTHADRVHPVSGFLKKLVLEKFPDKDVVEPFPAYMELDPFLAKKTTLGKEIFFVGSLYKLKNVEVLLSAFHEFRKKIKNYKLKIVGEGPNKKSLQEFSRMLGVEKDVVFLGNVKNTMLPETLSDAMCLVLPSLSEGFGVVLIEANALKKPIIGSNVGGIPEIIRNGVNGYVVEPNDISTLAERLIYLAENPLKAAFMGQRGYKWVKEQFSAQKYFDSYELLVKFR